MIKLFQFLFSVFSLRGKTRFIVALSTISAEVYLGYVCPDGLITTTAMWLIAVIAVIYIVFKTIYDLYVIKKLPVDKMGNPEE